MCLAIIANSAKLLAWFRLNLLSYRTHGRAAYYLIACGYSISGAYAMLVNLQHEVHQAFCMIVLDLCSVCLQILAHPIPVVFTRESLANVVGLTSWC